MSKPQALIVATDFSKHADLAVTRAIELARQGGAALHIVHVFAPPIPFATPYDLPVPDLYLAEARKQCTERLANCEDRARAAGVEVKTHMSVGPVWQAITELAAELEADLLVVATRGLSGLKHALVGSVAERVVQHAPCSVLVVRERQSDAR